MITVAQSLKYTACQVTDQYNERWRTDWITSDFWHILNFTFLCVIAFLWRPSASATRFAYSALDGMSQYARFLLALHCNSTLQLQYYVQHWPHAAVFMSMWLSVSAEAASGVS